MDILETLAARGAILQDMHFVYKSGKHGPHYINMDPVFPDVGLMLQLGGDLAAQFNATDASQLTVVGAATGAIPLALVTAMHLNNGTQYPMYAWADKKGDDFVFERAGFAEQLAGKRVLVVEDLLNTGDTVKKVIAQVRERGGNVIGVSVVCNRGSETAVSLDVPRLEQLASVDFKAYDAGECPLCADAIPIVFDVGHGDTFQLKHSEYEGGYITLLS